MSVHHDHDAECAVPCARCPHLLCEHNGQGYRTPGVRVSFWPEGCDLCSCRGHLVPGDCPECDGTGTAGEQDEWGTWFYFDCGDCEGTGKLSVAGGKVQS